MKIAILGAGAFGTAIGGILAANGYDIDYYDPRIERERLSDVLAGAMLVVLCVPSKAVAGVLPHLPATVPLAIATKGILSDAGFQRFEDWMVLSGPGFADDIKAHKETWLTVTDERLTQLLAADYMKFDFTEDRRGVLMCGALKNVYAIAAGFEALARETAEWEEFITVATSEMREILALNGADAATLDLVCGKGDLRLTCGLPSRNYEFGLRLRDDLNCQPEKTVEGVTALTRIMQGEIMVPQDAVVLRKLMEVRKWV